MARLLSTFTLYLVALTAVGLLLNSLIALTVGISALGSAVAIIAQLLATMWSGARYAQRTGKLPEPAFLWRAAAAMTLILGLVWAVLVLVPFSPWGWGSGSGLVNVVRSAIWVFLATAAVIAVITLFGTRYVLRQSILSIVAEQERNLRDRF